MRRPGSDGEELVDARKRGDNEDFIITAYGCDCRLANSNLRHSAGGGEGRQLAEKVAL